MQLRDEVERAGEAGADADGAEVAAVGGEDAIDLAAFGDGGDGAIDEAESELLEFDVECERAREIGRQGQLVFVTGHGIEDFGEEFAHGGAIGSEEIVHFREDEGRNDDDAGGN